MQKPDLEITRRLVEAWQPRLGMRGWEIDVYVSSGDRDQNWSMRAEHQDNYERGTIEIHPRVFGMVDPETRSQNFDYDMHENVEKFEKCLVHEMLHLLFRRRDRARRRIADQVPDEAREAFRIMSDDADEEIIEQLSRTLVGLSPLYAEVLPQEPFDHILGPLSRS